MQRIPRERRNTRTISHRKQREIGDVRRQRRNKRTEAEEQEQEELVENDLLVSMLLKYTGDFILRLELVIYYVP